MGELAYKEKERNASTINYAKEPAPILNEGAYSPYQTLEEYRTEKGFQFKAGDAVVSRGVSFISATISQSTDDQTHFSHGVFVYQDPKTQKMQGRTF